MRSVLSFTLVVLFGCGQHKDLTSSTTEKSVKQESRQLAKANQPVGSPTQSLVNSIGMKLVRIPSGEFLMGSADSDPGGREDEKPPHRVRLSRSFYMGIYEVTQGQYQQIMQANPSSFTKAGLLGDRAEQLDASQLPVENVTWYGALEFCRRLSHRASEKEAGRVYRLPTEAEWEYACRAGTTTVFNFGDSLSSEQANFNGNFPFGNAGKAVFLNRTTTVGSYPPNAFGLYDMHGNLHEWCLDKFDRDYYSRSPGEDPTGPEKGTSPVIRGGDWYSDGRDCRSAFRYADLPEGTFYALGFRVVCEMTSAGAALHPLVASVESETSERRPLAKAQQAARPLPDSAESWPQWRGPRRDGSWRGPKLPRAWPAAGLPRAWSRELGGGYGGIAVSSGRVMVMDRQEKPEEAERLHCIDAVTGDLKWSHTDAVDYGPVAYGNGPRSTPTVFQDHVYTLGAVGRLNCLNLASGELVWSKDLVSEFDARVPLWGLSASPLVFEDLLIVHPGATPAGCYIAFDLKTGDLRWQSGSDAAGYSTPMIIQRGDNVEMVGWTPSHVRGLDPRTGDSHWEIPFEVNYGTSIADPIYHDSLVLVSSYYDGSLALRLGDERGNAEEAWHDRRNLRGVMSQPLYRDGYAYLLDRRHGLTCFEFATGTKVWDDDNRMTPKGRNPQSTMVWLGDEDRVIVLNSEGDLILIRLNPEGYVEQSRTNIIGRTWAHPAYAGNCVYARSDTEIVCVPMN